MRVDSRMNKYNHRNPNRRAVEKRVAEIEANCTKRAKKLDATFAAGNNSNPFLSVYKSYGKNGIDSLVVGHFGEVNKGFKQLICSLAKVAADSQEAGNITPASSTDHKERCLRFIQEMVQSCARLYGDKDSDRTNDTSGTSYKKHKRRCYSGSMRRKYQRICTTYERS